MPDPKSPNPLSHFNEHGHAHMVDVGEKPETRRTAIASGRIMMDPATVDLIRSGSAEKGDVLGIARVAAIMAAKRTSDLVPLCHPLPITHVSATFDVEPSAVRIEVEARTTGKTGVEMEALTAVSVGLLTVYDMVKAVDRGMVIRDVRLEEKRGGASGTWTRQSSETRDEATR